MGDVGIGQAGTLRGPAGTDRETDRAFALLLLDALTGETPVVVIEPEPADATIGEAGIDLTDVGPLTLDRAADRAFALRLLDAVGAAPPTGRDADRPILTVPPPPTPAPTRPPAALRTPRSPRPLPTDPSARPARLHRRPTSRRGMPRFHRVEAPELGLPSCCPGPGYLLVKSFFDRLDAALLLLIASPVLLVAMAAVKLTSPGPVFFRQERLGKDGRRFTMLKLRTMVTDAEEQLRRLGLYDRYVEAGFKLPPGEDCRLTRIGAFLRRTSLDELPQLINVLRGDMSLVGPRPIVPPELACYGDRADCYLEVRPGLTGLWQITGRSTVTFPERGDIDAEYHARRSLRFDLVILVRTPMVVLKGTGAY